MGNQYITEVDPKQCRDWAQLSAMSPCAGVGATQAQDLYIRVDLLVPASAAGVVQAGPYFRSRAASPGDGIIGGSSAGY
jgi:hypothetical protein